MYITVCTLQELHRGILGAAVLIDNKQHAYAYRNWMHEWLHVLVVMCVNRTGLCVCKAACAGVYVRQPHKDVCLQGCMCWCLCASTAQGCLFARLHVLVCVCVNRTGMCVCKAACAGVYVRQPHRDVCLQGCMCWCLCASTAQGCVFARLHVLVCMCVNRTGLCVSACLGPHRWQDESAGANPLPFLAPDSNNFGIF